MRYFIISIFIFFASFQAKSATQGVAGTSSTGTIDINISLSDVVQISALNDINFPSWSNGDGAVEAFDDLCVYSNTSGGGYNVTAQGQGAGFAFEVDDGGVNIMPYDVFWNDVSGTEVGRVSLSANGVLTSQTGASTNQLVCDGGSSLTSRVTIGFSNSSLNSAQVAVYSGTLTLIVAPE
jgi:hypothetical protein